MMMMMKMVMTVRSSSSGCRRAEAGNVCLLHHHVSISLVASSSHRLRGNNAPSLPLPGAQASRLPVAEGNLTPHPDPPPASPGVDASLPFSSGPVEGVMAACFLRHSFPVGILST